MQWDPTGIVNDIITILNSIKTNNLSRILCIETCIEI